MQQKKESFFWTSYSDLMTSLFFIMLTLFVLVVVLLHKRMEATEQQMEATEQQLEEIKKLEASTRELDKSGYYAYKTEYKKYVLNVRCFFDELQSDLGELKADRDSLKNAGFELQQFLKRNSLNHYLLIIEGQASRNSTNQTDQNYRLSFQRALTLMKFWKNECRIDFGTNCEIQIAGSGDGRYNFGFTDGESSPRFAELDNTLMRERGFNEYRNQRFVIHIIPKNIIENVQE